MVPSHWLRCGDASQRRVMPCVVTSGVNEPMHILSALSCQNETLNVTDVLLKLLAVQFIEQKQRCDV